MIRHTVIFKLKHTAGSQEELNFLQSALKLADLQVVKNFECLRQIRVDLGAKSLIFANPWS